MKKLTSAQTEAACTRQTADDLIVFGDRLRFTWEAGEGLICAGHHLQVVSSGVGAVIVVPVGAKFKVGVESIIVVRWLSKNGIPHQLAFIEGTDFGAGQWYQVELKDIKPTLCHTSM